MAVNFLFPLFFIILLLVKIFYSSYATCEAVFYLGSLDFLVDFLAPDFLASLALAVILGAALSLVCKKEIWLRSRDFLKLIISLIASNFLLSFYMCYLAKISLIDGN